MRKEEEEVFFFSSSSSTSSSSFHMKYDVIQSVFIVETYIRKIPCTKSRSQYLIPLRSRYPTKCFLIQYSFLTSYVKRLVFVKSLDR